jgi:hypothetical protein
MHLLAHILVIVCYFELQVPGIKFSFISHYHLQWARHVSERTCSCAGCTGDSASRYNTGEHQQTIFALVISVLNWTFLWHRIMLCYQSKASDPNVCNLFTHTIYFSTVPKFRIFLFDWSNSRLFIPFSFDKIWMIKDTFYFYGHRYKN